MTKNRTKRFLNNSAKALKELERDREPLPIRYIRYLEQSAIAGLEVNVI